MRAKEFEQDFDKVLLELCHRVIKGQRIDKHKYGMVAACVIDPENRKVSSTSTFEQGLWQHAERNAINNYISKYGKIPEGSIIVTTLSPCNEEMDDRFGESCTDLINFNHIKNVYCGYIDPSQHNLHAKYSLKETEMGKIKDLCKSFADTFLKKK